MNSHLRVGSAAFRYLRQFRHRRLRFRHQSLALLGVRDDLRSHARVPEAREMGGDDVHRIVGIGHLVGGDVVEHFNQAFDVHGLFALAVDDARGMGVDDEVGSAHRRRA